MVLVDGEPQFYEIVIDNTVEKNAAYQQHFQLEENEKIEFNIRLKLKGYKKGDRLGIVFATVFEPNYRPDFDYNNMNSFDYRIYHSLSSTAPQTIDYQQDDSKESNRSNIDWENFNLNSEYLSSSIAKRVQTSQLQNRVYPLLHQNEENGNTLTSTEENLEFILDILGGQDGVKYKAIIFVNHFPVEIEGEMGLEFVAEKGIAKRTKLSISVSGVD